MNDIDHYRNQCSFKISYTSRAEARIAARKASAVLERWGHG